MDVPVDGASGQAVRKAGDAMSPGRPEQLGRTGCLRMALDHSLSPDVCRAAEWASKRPTPAPAAGLRRLLPGISSLASRPSSEARSPLNPRSREVGMNSFSCFSNNPTEAQGVEWPVRGCTAGSLALGPDAQSADPQAS